MYQRQGQQQKPSAKTLQNLYRRVFAEVSAESAHHAGPVFVLDGERYADTKRFNLAVDHDPNALAACLDVLQRKGGVAVEFLAVRRKQECAAVLVNRELPDPARDSRLQEKALSVR